MHERVAKMNVIEKAAKRLEELERAGIKLPRSTTGLRDVVAEKRGALDRAGTTRNTDGESLDFETHQKRSHGDEQGRDRQSSAGTGSRRIELDLARLAAANIMTPDAPRSQLADEFRVIKRPLLENASGKGGRSIRNGNLIIVTSALPGEGKSFTAANLAMSIAMEMDRTVLLVDADVARPSLPEMLGLPAAQGLLDLLLDDSLDLSKMLMKTDVETLSVLCSGTPHARATELLASNAMTRLLEEMAQRYSDRIIIFDSPPLLVTTEARVLASHMGQVVLVVQGERTAHSTVMQALATIESCPVKLMMLNKGRVEKSSGHAYGYGYYDHRT
jgi:protein-tyrosine kinase